MKYLPNTYIHINEVKNMCRMCKRDFNPLYTHSFPLRGDIICVCEECLVKIENFIKTESVKV